MGTSWRPTSVILVMDAKTKKDEVQRTEKTGPNISEKKSHGFSSILFVGITVLVAIFFGMWKNSQRKDYGREYSFIKEDIQRMEWKPDPNFANKVLLFPIQLERLLSWDIQWYSPILLPICGMLSPRGIQNTFKKKWQSLIMSKNMIRRPFGIITSPNTSLLWWKITQNTRLGKR